MKFVNIPLFLASLLSARVIAQECSSTWKCRFVGSGTPPVLDSDLGEWDNVEPYVSDLFNTAGVQYEGGQATFKCQYDWDNIYFAMEIPGEYRFSTEDNHLCASIGTMMKVGPKASFLNMGGCPDAMTSDSCADGVIPESCVDYTVDIGAHWELKTTEQKTLYSMGGKGSAPVGNKQASSSNSTEPAGNDLVANNDDEYAVSPYCRFDDNDAKAGNEWSGAWAHTNSVEAEFGTYLFEVSRTLKTKSTVSDAQLAPGETIEFGIAYWDPFQMEETGWNDIGHYFTGCGTKWVNLELVAADEDKDDVWPSGGSSRIGIAAEDLAETDPVPSAAASMVGFTGMMFSLLVPALAALV